MWKRTDSSVRLKTGPEESGLARRSLESGISLDANICIIKPLIFFDKKMSGFIIKASFPF